MAKISEMSEDQLRKYLSIYKSKLESGEYNPDDQKKFNALTRALGNIENIESDDTPSDIKTYHSSKVDFMSYEDASFGTRAIALLLDSIFLGVVNKVFSLVATYIVESSLPSQVKLASMVINIISILVVPSIYYVYFLRRGGQTLGKKIMKIKVIYQNSNDELRVGTIIVRESIGKFISSFVLGLGYLWRLFGKTTWHDSMANTKVISLK